MKRAPNNRDVTLSRLSHGTKNRFFTAGVDTLLQWGVLSLYLFTATAGGAETGRPASPTMSFKRPLAIEASGKIIELKQHAATRLYDWDQDHDLDLVVGAGDGRLWLFRNHGTSDRPAFQSKVPVLAGSRARWGDSYTGLVFTQLVGSPLPDLVICHSGNQVFVHENIGIASEPKFAETHLTFFVQDNCQGRFDIADWDADGLPDLITGSFGGKLMWHRNEGQRGHPNFAEGLSFADISLAYNSHPRLFDFDQDGQLDLLLGVNWGTVSLFLKNASQDSFFSKSKLLQWSDGTNLNIRQENGDDTTPELADLDGDGVLDLISGGKNGRLFFMKGVGFTTRAETFAKLLAEHGSELGRTLRTNTTLREQLFGSLAALQADLASGLIPASGREQLFQELAPLVKQYPGLLGRSRFDLNASPHLPVLAGQFWVVLLDTLTDSIPNRRRVAKALNFQAGYQKLLVDFGVLFIDNDTATPEHLAAMHRLLTAIPPNVWDVETITVADWIGPGLKTQKIRSRSGINIFALPLGRPENSFADDAPRPGLTDVYLICLAHEIAHNMLDTVGKKNRPELFERKFECLSQAAGTQVVYRTPKSLGINFDATKANFRNMGVWNGDASNWNQAWKNFFSGKESFDRAYTRGNVQFFLDSPQEAFATLANQYFADSQLMLDFCKVRWDAGHLSNINQFLLIADYLSEGNNQVNFYVMRPGGNLRVTTVKLGRDSQGRITRLVSRDSTATFEYQDGNMATGFEIQPQ